MIHNRKEAKMAKTMTIRSLGLLVLAFVLMGWAAPAQAQAKPNPLTVSFQNVSLARDTARARAVKATAATTQQAAANDTLRFALVFNNNEGRALKDIVFENPLAANLRLIGGTVTTSSPATVEYSIDGGKTYSARPTIAVIENGAQVQRPVAPESYTHIRWTIRNEIAPGARVTAQFDAVVATRPAPRAVR
jgi:uncharacterized repeat protein (TIGR01451 family)